MATTTRPNVGTIGDIATCITCKEGIFLDDNGAGTLIWVHDHGSTVCYDNPPGTIDGDVLHTAEPANA